MEQKCVLAQSYGRKIKTNHRKYFVLVKCQFANLLMNKPFKGEPPGAGTFRLEVYDSKTKFEKRFQPCLHLSLDDLFHVDILHRRRPSFGIQLFKETQSYAFAVDTDSESFWWRDNFQFLLQRNKKEHFYLSPVEVLEASVKFKSRTGSTTGCTPAIPSCRIVFTNEAILLVTLSLKHPDFVLEYSTIRNFSLQYNHVLILHLGRASPLGECNVHLRLADEKEAKFACSCVDVDGRELLASHAMAYTSRRASGSSNKTTSTDKSGTSGVVRPGGYSNSSTSSSTSQKGHKLLPHQQQHHTISSRIHSYPEQDKSSIPICFMCKPNIVEEGDSTLEASVQETSTEETIKSNEVEMSQEKMSTTKQSTHRSKPIHVAPVSLCHLHSCPSKVRRMGEGNDISKYSSSQYSHAAVSNDFRRNTQKSYSFSKKSTLPSSNDTNDEYVLMNTVVSNVADVMEEMSMGEHYVLLDASDFNEESSQWEGRPNTFSRSHSNQRSSTSSQFTSSKPPHSPSNSDAPSNSLGYVERVCDSTSGPDRCSPRLPIRTAPCISFNESSGESCYEKQDMDHPTVLKAHADAKCNKGRDFILQQHIREEEPVDARFYKRAYSLSMRPALRRNPALASEDKALRVNAFGEGPSSPGNQQNITTRPSQNSLNASHVPHSFVSPKVLSNVSEVDKRSNNASSLNMRTNAGHRQDDELFMELCFFDRPRTSSDSRAQRPKFLQRSTAFLPVVDSVLRAMRLKINPPCETSVHPPPSSSCSSHKSAAKANNSIKCASVKYPKCFPPSLNILSTSSQHFSHDKRNEEMSLPLGIMKSTPGSTSSSFYSVPLSPVKASESVLRMESTSKVSSIKEEVQEIDISRSITEEVVCEDGSSSVAHSTSRSQT